MSLIMQPTWLIYWMYLNTYILSIVLCLWLCGKSCLGSTIYWHIGLTKSHHVYEWMYTCVYMCRYTYIHICCNVRVCVRLKFITFSLLHLLVGGKRNKIYEFVKLYTIYWLWNAKKKKEKKKEIGFKFC